MPKDSEKIQLLHPEEGKKLMRLDKDKYDQIKKEVLTILKEQKSITPSGLFTEMTNRLTGKFDGKIGWYTEGIKLDLEARGIIAHDRKTRQINLLMDN